MENMQLPQDFREFIALLNANDVHYLLIGGYAVGYYGYPRATQDIGIWIASNPTNAEKMADVMRRFGFEEGAIPKDVFLKNEGVVRISTPPMRLEILMVISGVTFDRCYEKSLTVAIGGTPVRIIHLSDSGTECPPAATLFATRCTAKSSEGAWMKCKETE